MLSAIAIVSTAVTAVSMDVWAASGREPAGEGTLYFRAEKMDLDLKNTTGILNLILGSGGCSRLASFTSR
jgi:hypothetical protein